VDTRGQMNQAIAARHMDVVISIGTWRFSRTEGTSRNRDGLKAIGG
jgi:hypothetical protein